MRIKEYWDKGKLIRTDEIEEESDKVESAKKVLQDKVDAAMIQLTDITVKTSMTAKDMEDAIRYQTSMLQDLLGVSKIDTKKIKP